MTHTKLVINYSFGPCFHQIVDLVIVINNYNTTTCTKGPHFGTFNEF